MTIDDLVKMAKRTDSVVTLTGKSDDDNLIFLVIGAYATNEDEQIFLKALEKFTRVFGEQPLTINGIPVEEWAVQEV